MIWGVLILYQVPRWVDGQTIKNQDQLSLVGAEDEAELVKKGFAKISLNSIKFYQYFKTKFILSRVGVGQIKIKDHLSPAEAETGTELGKNPATGCKPSASKYDND